MSTPFSSRCVAKQCSARRAADLQLAPSTDHANPWNGTLHLSRDFPANGAGTNSLALRRHVQADRSGKKLLEDQLEGIMPARGRWRPSGSVSHRAVDLQLAPSTHIKLDGRKHIVVISQTKLKCRIESAYSVCHSS